MQLGALLQTAQIYQWVGTGLPTEGQMQLAVQLLNAPLVPMEQYMEPPHLLLAALGTAPQCLGRTGLALEPSVQPTALDCPAPTQQQLGTTTLVMV